MIALVSLSLLASMTGEVSAETQSGEESRSARMSLRLLAGPEFDSNANRSLVISREDSKSDRLVRLVMDSKLHYRLSKIHSFSGSYLLGTKRFQEEDAEDVIVQNIVANSRHEVTERVHMGSVFRYRQTRMRSILRDYSLGRGGLRVGWKPVPMLDIWAAGGGQRFIFPQETRLNYLGPYASVGLSWKVSPYFRWDFFAVFEQQYFDGNALTTIEPIGGSQLIATFCDDDDRRFRGRCESQIREDAFFLSSIKVSYQRLYIVGAELQYQSKRSNSVYEDINRIRISVFATRELGLGIIVNALAAIQYTSEQSLSQNIYQYQPEDDENQNRLSLQLSRSLYNSASAVLRYELFANAFATNDTAFFRQTVFAGLSFVIDS
jgi:hypothetical protein